MIPGGTKKLMEPHGHSVGDGPNVVGGILKENLVETSEKTL